ncbi:MAG TPA: aminotransferase class III-fold pyridoxal phosphate-dependent enzyme, partial [Phycisphaerae bacterium]|nr:aminotransferase class III-fold pyridoxal phosphate-dependent enzyme [Phycisphaerae bacterium]
FMGLEAAEVSAEGCYVTASDGSRYLDCLGGPGVFTLGHRPAAVIEAVKRQLDEMPLSSHMLPDPLLAELAERLAHPRYGVPKTYRAHVNGAVTADDLARLRKGVWLAEGKTRVSDAKIIHRGRERSVIEITLQEGRNREVRRVLARLGHNVRKLMRIRIGPLSLRGLPPGGFRPLTRQELKELREYRPPKRGRPGDRAPDSMPQAGTPASAPPGKRVLQQGPKRAAAPPDRFGRHRRRPPR